MDLLEPPTPTSWFLPPVPLCGLPEKRRGQQGTGRTRAQYRQRARVNLSVCLPRGCVLTPGLTSSLQTVPWDGLVRVEAGATCLLTVSPAPHLPRYRADPCARSGELTDWRDGGPGLGPGVFPWHGNGAGWDPGFPLKQKQMNQSCNLTP